MINSSSQKTPQVLIDCDPGSDDFFALLWALSLHKKNIITIRGIATSGGNVGPDITYRNALQACQYMDIMDIPVARSSIAIISEDASHIHGDDGIGGASRLLPAVEMPEKTLTSEDLFRDCITRYPHIQILEFGPMTNIAHHIRQFPENMPARVIAMGGAIHVGGNVTPNAEFNFSYDPEAADFVLSHVPNTVIIPLDTTNTILFTRREMHAILTKIPETKRAFLQALTEYVFQTNMSYRETAGVEGFLVHDASVIGMLLYPHLFTGQFLPLRIETKGEFTRGACVTDTRNIPQPEKHTFVALTVDRARFMEAMVQDF